MQWLGNPESVGWDLLLQRQAGDASAARQALPVEAPEEEGGGSAGISVGVLIGCIVAAIGELPFQLGSGLP